MWKEHEKDLQFDGFTYDQMTPLLHSHNQKKTNIEQLKIPVHTEYVVA